MKKFSYKLFLVLTFLVFNNISAKKVKSKPKTKSKSVFSNIFASKGFKELNFEELQLRRQEHLDSKNYHHAALCIEREIELCKDELLFCDLRLDQADIWLKAGDLEKSASCYREFLTLYPGHKNAAKAKYCLIRLLFDSMLACNRDQTGTKEALDLARKFLKNKTYKKYHQKVRDIMNVCVLQLFRSEVSDIEFFLKGKKIKSVDRRIKALKKTYLTKDKLAENIDALNVVKELEAWQEANKAGKKYFPRSNKKSKNKNKKNFGTKF